MRWCKNGNLVLKNRVKDTILRENVHEEKFLGSTLSNLNKHQTEEERHLVNKRLQFAKMRTKSVGISEQLHHFRERKRSFSDGAIQMEKQHGQHRRKFDAKLKWQKAISVVRLVVQNNPNNNRTVRRQRPRQASFFPNIIESSPRLNPNCSLTPHHRRNVANKDHLVLPRVQTATNKNCLEDPRFLKLQEILSLDNNDNSVSSKSAWRRMSKEDKDGRNGGRKRSQTCYL